MNPKPFSALNHLTVPLAMLLVLRCGGGIPGWFVGGASVAGEPAARSTPWAAHLSGSARRGMGAVLFLRGSGSGGGPVRAGWGYLPLAASLSLEPAETFTL